MRNGTLLLDNLSSTSELLEALVELGEALVGPGISAAHSQVFYTASDGSTHKLYVTKTRWAELRDSHSLVVRKV